MTRGSYFPMKLDQVRTSGVDSTLKRHGPLRRDAGVPKSKTALPRKAAGAIPKPQTLDAGP